MKMVASKLDELQSENARLREVLEGVLRLEDLIRYPDTVLPAQHQGEAEAINLMLDKIKAALTTTPKTMNEDEYPKWLTEADIVWLKKAEKDYQSDITMIPIEPKDDHANGLIQGILYERERQASELDKLRKENANLKAEIEENKWMNGK